MERLEEIEKRVSNMPVGMPTQVITWQGWKDVKILFEDDYKYLRGQAERVEEQQKEIERYRDYLTLIRNTGTHGTHIETKEVVRSDEANLAHEALEGK